MRALALGLLILVSASIYGCASNQIEFDRYDFISECTQAPGGTLLKCTYIEYNNAVTAVNTSIKRKNDQEVISDETKDSYKEKIIELNSNVEKAYSLENIGQIEDQRDLLVFLRQYLENNLDSEGKVQL